MRKLFHFLMIISFSISACCEDKTDPIHGQDPDDEHESNNEESSYKLVWEEEFNKSTLDERIWNIEITHTPANQELQEYKKDNITIGKEPKSGKQCLIITAKKEYTVNKRNFTSGRLNTMKKVAFRYGRIDARIKLPKTANGLWPAFWMKGNDNDIHSWPSCGEIDILEMGNRVGINNNTQETLIGHACHWGTPPPNYNLSSAAKKSISPYSLQDENFHLYSMIWDEQKISFYVDLDLYPDRSPYYVFNHGLNDKKSSLYFNKEFYILLNLAVGGQYTGIFGTGSEDKITALNKSNNFEAKMYIDYIKIYQKGDKNETIIIPKK